ncbi:MAG: class I SAM-dependent methyltransferase [Cypionkella sp.]
MLSDSKFVGPVPEIYDRFMVPLVFEAYAVEMAARVAALRPGAILEIAAGSGVVTRALAPLLAAGARYVVTDLNPPMLDQAKARQPPDDRIEWAVADALSLPFAKAEFDVVCCQFGAMFFSDKTKGYGEVLRVLKPGAPFVFSVWDSMAHNVVTEVVCEVVRKHYPANPPDFFERVPFGYFNPAQIKADLGAAGFSDVTIDTVTRESRAPTARDAAVALCMGTPLRMAILERDPEGLGGVTDLVEAALRQRYGAGPICAKMQALVVVARA